MSFAVLSALAESPELQRDDFAALHAYARRVLTNQAVGTTIGLVGREGRFILLTRFPFGQELPAVSADDISKSVFATGRRQASDLFFGTVTLDQLVTLDVPVFRNGQVIYDLRFGVRPASLEPLLAEQLLPEYWTSVIVDRKGRYIARSHAPDRVGEQASVPLRTQMAVAETGIFDGYTALGVPIKGAFQKLPSVGWVVAIGVPQAKLNAPLRHSLMLVGLGGAMLLTIGCLGALLLARRVGLQLAETTAAAIAVGEGAAPALTKTDILELFELRKALDLAHHLLSQRAERLTLALEAARAAAWEYDHATGSLAWSPESAALYGFDAAQPPKSVRDCLGFIFDEDRPVVEAKLQHPVGGDVIRAEFRIRHPLAGRRWLLVVGRAIYAEDQKLLRVVGLSIDITERHEAEEATLKAKHDAERANQAKSKFLASASHDLRQPVQSLMLFSSLLSDQLRGRQAAKTVGHVEKATLALKALLDSILDISRLEAGIIIPSPCAIGGGPFLDLLAEEYRLVAAQKGVELRLVRTGLWLRSDPTLLERILRNLIDNAIKYTPSGRILIGCRRQGAAVRIEIWDTGIGIADDQKDSVFQEFHQIDNPERDRTKGLGLGLAIVDRLARLLGHELRLRSALGRGSCFSVAVPRAAPETPARGKAPPRIP